MTPLSGDVLGRYRLESELGRGGMGVVFVAFDTRLERRVALKVIAPDISGDSSFRVRFEREMRIAAQLEHPNVIPVHEAGEIDGLLFIAMRYVEGEDMRKRLRREGGIGGVTAQRFATQLGAALDAAHERGLVHRDVKPANILLSAGSLEQHLYLSDFGLAREVASDSGLTNTGQWMGTIDYVAPEQIDGGLISARSDVYSMGCVLFEMLTGRVPFEGSIVHKLFAHASKPLPSVGNAGGDFVKQIDTVLARATAKRPAGRFSSAGDLGRAFAEALLGRAPSVSERSVATGVALAGIQTASAPDRAMPQSPSKTVLEDAHRPIAQDTAPATGRTNVMSKPRRVAPLILAAVLVPAAAAGAYALLGNGPDRSKPATHSSSALASAAALKAVVIKVTAPTNNGTINTSRVAVRGTVDPANAIVEVQGRRATVGNGVFSAYASVGPGRTTIDVIGSATGSLPGLETIVVQSQAPSASNSNPGNANQTTTSSSAASAGGLPNVSPTQMASDIAPVIQQFYQDQIDGQYQAMKLLTSARYQTDVIDPSFDQWVQNQRTGTQYFSHAQDISVNITAEDPGDSSVTVYVSGLHFDKAGSTCTMWQGVTWAQYADGVWRYDPGTQATASRSSFAQSHASDLIGAGCLG